MSYTIKEASARTGIPATTLRYYDKEGLLPFIERRESGYRLFSDGDIMMLRVIECLKSTGMSIKDIRQFSEWVQQGDATLHQRYEMFLERRRIVEAQMEELQKTLDLIDHKCRYYETAIEAGTERIHLPAGETDGRFPCEE
ncbi:MAG: MerR family transcriptional regulator [Hominenteromicrobium sp.]